MAKQNKGPGKQLEIIFPGFPTKAEAEVIVEKTKMQEYEQRLAALKTAIKANAITSYNVKVDTTHTIKKNR